MESWIPVVVGAIGQLLIGGIFLGRIDQRVCDVVTRLVRGEERQDLFDKRLIDCGERLARVEVRTGNCESCRITKMAWDGQNRRGDNV